MNKTYRIEKLLLIMVILVAGVFHNASAKKKQEPVLNAKGKELKKEYMEMLDSLSKGISAALPKVDPKKKDDLIKARALYSSVVKPGKTPDAEVVKAYKEAMSAAEAASLIAIRPLLKDLEGFLSNENLDSKLIKATILRHGTPAGLAEFAQQSDEHKALLDKLFSDEALMKQMVIAGGANGGDYGEAMEVYTAILKASEKAREPGILQRLAVGTALHMPWIPGKDRGAVPGPIFRTRTDIEQVPRFLHYEKAYLNNELDPAFKDMNTWECRFITNSEYSNEDLAWMRKMMRNFRPDHIRTEEQKWRYSKFVKSDVPYTSTKHDPSLGSPAQMAICLGGICGRRAFIGRLTTRAFGIPTRASTQSGHAAMSRWTSEGWQINLGAWWSMAWCGPQGGLDFYLDSQAREFSEKYMQILRAQWIGNALAEEDVNIRQYGQGGGFWDGLAFAAKQLVVDDAQKDEEENELANLSAEEARLLGESDKILGDGEVKPIEIPEKDKKITIAEDGTITVPAVACTSPKNNTDKILFLDSWEEGMQLHYQRLGKRPEILRYTIEVPDAGKYELSLNVCTVSQKYEVIARINRRTLVNILLPYSKGIWESTKPEVIELRKGRNTLMFTFRAPNRGVSIKHFKLKPVK